MQIEFSWAYGSGGATESGNTNACARPRWDFCYNGMVPGSASSKDVDVDDDGAAGDACPAQDST